MAKRKDTPANRFTRCRVIKGITNDTLGERHEPGTVADLSKWPVEVLERWVKRGVIEVEETKPKVTSDDFDPKAWTPEERRWMATRKNKE